MRSRLLLYGLFMAVMGGVLWLLTSKSTGNDILKSPASTGVAISQPRQDSVGVVKRLHGHVDGVHAVAFSPDGKLLASAGADGSVRLWNVATGMEVRKLEGHISNVTCVAFSANGEKLLTGGNDSQAILWDVKTGDVEAVLLHRYFVIGVGFLPDGDHFVTASQDELILWKIGADKPVQKLLLDANVQCMQVSKAGTVTTGDTGGSIIVWDVLKGERVAQRTRKTTTHVPGLANGIVSIWLNDDGNALFSDFDAVWAWDVKRDKISVAWPRWEISVGFDSDRLTIEAAGEWLCVRNQTLSYHEMREGKGHIHGFAVSPAGDYIAVARGGEYRNEKWVAAGPQDVELYSIHEMVKAAREAEERAVRLGSDGHEVMRAETQAATTRIGAMPSFGWE